MKDPKRLLDGGATDDERAMLEAARREHPAAGAERAARAAILLAALPADSTVLPASTSATTSAGAMMGGTKLLVTTALAVAIGATAAYVAPRFDAPTVHTPTSGRQLAFGSGTRLESAEPADVDETVVHRESIELVEAIESPVTKAPKKLVPTRPRAPMAEPTMAEPTVAEPTALEPGAVEVEVEEDAAPKGPSARDSARSSGGLKREVFLVKTARDAMDAGDAEAARFVIDVYEKEFVDGLLREEAAALDVDVAFMADAADAEDRARRFLENHPNSPHVDHVRALMTFGIEK